MASKGEMWVFDLSCITQLQSQMTNDSITHNCIAHLRCGHSHIRSLGLTWVVDWLYYLRNTMPLCSPPPPKKRHPFTVFVESLKLIKGRGRGYLSSDATFPTLLSMIVHFRFKLFFALR